MREMRKGKLAYRLLRAYKGGQQMRREASLHGASGGRGFVWNRWK